MYVVTFSSLLILMAEDLDGYEGDEDRIQGHSFGCCWKKSEACFDECNLLYIIKSISETSSDSSNKVDFYSSFFANIFLLFLKVYNDEADTLIISLENVHLHQEASSLWLPLVAVLRTIRRWELAGSSEQIDTAIVCDKGEVDFRGDSKFGEHSCHKREPGYTVT
ncbi:hypothetical protein IGI04_003244 [Brassica rapa subsp. trilocularis]|uniref:Uncharacterized protein n=1 Tax=Brassica rapa subsp. trilocularis TaxID=1813537 RepID=A0ABQ7NXT7_BRACM|nr:hypothetical protein IGI04_003244 [Brassica rapa subsp. trilocularis]